MKLGERLTIEGTLTEENMAFLKQLGVNNIMAGIGAAAGQVDKLPVISNLRRGDFLETADLIELKRFVANHGLELFGISHTPFSRWDKIIRGLPGRDQQIENWNKSLRNLGRADIRLLQYNWVIDAAAWLPNWRTTDKTVGRGGARYVSFDNEVAQKVPVTSEFGVITEDELWKNLEYFLKATIPVAEEAGVKMAVHPADPQIPSIAGVARIIRSAEAYDRMFNIVKSDSNSMVFCLGCFSQMTDSEGAYKALRHFARENKIGYAHFRTVRGEREKFDEVYPDEGKLDMLECMKIFKEVGYNGIIFPDHTPHGAGDDEFGHRGKAYAIGYMKGLMQATGTLE